MGGQSAGQQNTGSQVYYDPEKQQYYTIKTNNQNQYSNPLANLFAGVLSPNERNYLGASLMPTTDRFTPRNIEPNYPDMNELFPALNAGLAQNLQTSLLAPTDTQSSGAARFLAPSNTSKGK